MFPVSCAMLRQFLISRTMFRESLMLPMCFSSSMSSTYSSFTESIMTSDSNKTLEWIYYDHEKDDDETDLPWVEVSVPALTRPIHSWSSNRCPGHTAPQFLLLIGPRWTNGVWETGALLLSDPRQVCQGQGHQQSQEYHGERQELQETQKEASGVQLLSIPSHLPLAC